MEPQKHATCGALTTPQHWGQAELDSRCGAWVRFWHWTDVPARPRDVRFRGWLGHSADRVEGPRL